MRVFVHGAGRVGREAWPAVDDDDGWFLSLAAGASMDEKVAAVREAISDGDTVVAHSAGAVPVALALRDGHVRPGYVVLVEPALYDIAR